MKITKRTSYKVTFAVEYFEDTEGGMNYDKFGDNVNTLEEAIHLLELAKSDKFHKDKNWIITCSIERIISRKES